MKKILNISFVALTFIFILFSSCKVQEQKLVFPLDADMLYNSYKSNISKGDKIYKDKELIVTGRILEYYKNKQGEAVIMISMISKTNGVSCDLINTSQQIKNPLKKGTLLKIKGICKGFNQNVILENCWIVQ